MISFFFLTHRKAGSGQIRGKQIGEYLGAKLNPPDGYQDDVCIYVKIPVPDDCPPNSYLDIMDAWQRIRWLQEHPEMKVICMSKTSQEFMNGLSIHNTFLIPQHHCNYERIRRTRDKVTTVGYIGRFSGFDYPLKDTAKRLNEMGLEFKCYQDYKNRLDVVEFYKTIDIQICFRMNNRQPPKLHSPLKLSNACSFGIPTVSYPEDNYRVEFPGCFLPAPTIDTLFSFVEILKNDPQVYEELAHKGREKAEEYHIENIAKLYRELESK